MDTERDTTTSCVYQQKAPKPSCRFPGRLRCSIPPPFCGQNCGAGGGGLAGGLGGAVPRDLAWGGPSPVPYRSPPVPRPRKG